MIGSYIMKISFILLALVLSLIMFKGYSYGEEAPPQQDPVEKLEEEQREVYGDPDEEMERYYESIRMRDINRDADYLLKDHPLQEEPLQEDPIPDNPIPDNPIPERPLDEELMR